MPAKPTPLLRIKKKKRLVGFVGGYLIDDGALTLDQLDHGLLRQLSLAQEGRAMRLGQILVEMGYVTPKQLERAIKRHDRDLGHAPSSKGKKRKRV